MSDPQPHPGEFRAANRDAPTPALELIASRTESAPGQDLPEVLDFLGSAQGPDELGRLGNYRVLKVLGRSHMAVVLLAEDLHLQRPVALKAMWPELARNPTAKERFLREGRAAAKLDHDHIVTVHQVGEERGVPYIAMPLLKGTSLEEFLEQSAKSGATLALGQIMKIGREVAEGLSAAHAQGLIHRDIKPANIWLDASAGGRVKILDFGLARQAETGEADLTQSGVIVGTPAFMAPEQARGEIVDARADLFSLGVVLYRMCTGVLPFQGKDSVSTLVLIAKDEPPSPARLNPQIPQSLSDLVMHLLAKDPARRVASAGDVVKALARLEKEASLPTADKDRTDDASIRPRAAPSVTSLETAGHRPTLRYKLLAVGMLIVGLAGGGAFYLGTVKSPEKNPDKAVPEQQVKVEPLTTDKVHALKVESLPKDKVQPPAPVFFQPVAGPPRLLTTIEYTGKVCDLAFTPNGGLLIVGGGNAKDGKNLRIYDPVRGAMVYQAGFLSSVNRMALSRDGKKLYFGGSFRQTDRPVIYVLDLVGKWASTTIPIQTRGLGAISISHDGKMLAYGEGKGMVQIYDLENARMGPEIKVGAWFADALQFSPDGKYLAVSDHIGTLEIWNTATWVELAHEPFGAFSGWVAVSPDSKLIAIGGKQAEMPAWHLFGIPGGELTQSEETVPQLTERGVFSPDGRFVAIGLADGSVRLWDVNAKQSLSAWPAHAPGRPYVLAVGGLAFSPDGKTLASGGGDGLVKLWDLTTRAAAAP